jgi:sulfoxide reductase heme-binding subunit YedZ
MSTSILWYATRGAGIVSLILFTAVVCMGVLTAVRWQRPGWPRFLTAELHQSMALTAVVFLAIHIVTAVVDPYTALGWTAALIPFSSPYRTLWLGLGAVTLYLFAAVVVTSLLRARLGHRAWRAVHWITWIAWPIALIHGLGTGTDTASWWMLTLDGLCVLAVAAAAVWRSISIDAEAREREGVLPAPRRRVLP